MSDKSTDNAGSPIAASDLSPASVKQCCAALYDSDVVKLLLGDSFHPGGIALTERLGELLNLTPRSRVLDVAAGRGTSAIALAKRFGCEVAGVDLATKNIAEANRAARDMGLGQSVSFQAGDAERLPFPDGAFDAVICECALCTFPNKQIAAHEFARVVTAGGQVGLSDLTRTEPLPPELGGLLSWAACIADAQPLPAYLALLSTAKLTVQSVEEHNHALTELVKGVRTRLLGVEVMAGLQRLTLPDFDLDAAKAVTAHAAKAIAQGQLGYAIMTAVKPAQ